MPLKVIRRKDTGALTITGTVKLPSGQGVRVRTRAQSDDIALAREEAAALEAQMLRDAWHGQRRGTRSFGEAVIAYLESEARSTGTKRRLNRLLRAIGDVPLGAINQETATRARLAMLAPDAAPATIRRGVIVPLRAVMLYAHKQLGWCDPPHFQVPREPNGRTRYLLPSEAERLILAAAPHLKPLLIFLLCTGARMSEALELEWRDVDLVGQRAIFWKTKSGGRRVATIPTRVVVCLAPLAMGGKVFRTNAGAAYADRARQGGGQIKTAWKAALRRAQLPAEITPHDLRHTWASWHYAVHRDLLALKGEGGWSSVVLAERYAHLLPAGHEAEIEAFWHGRGTAAFQQDVSA
jgi:integrase